MKNLKPAFLIASLTAAIAGLNLVGCDKPAEPKQSADARTGKPADTHDHAHDAKGDGHDHDHEDGHDHGPTTELGEQTSGTFTIKASREGDVVAGKDVAVNIHVAPAADAKSKAAAVRVWVGTQDGKGSMKARAEHEKTSWHAHAEIPSPLPEGSKLWIEIETDAGEKTVVGFDLKN